MPNDDADSPYSNILFFENKIWLLKKLNQNMTCLYTLLMIPSNVKLWLRLTYCSNV